MSQLTHEEISKHNSEGDCWVIIDKEVYDVTNFLADHPGGAKAVLIYAGRDATEEFDMLHERKVIQKYGIKTGKITKVGKVA
jgi:cytochrome b involved in lipid metabolism